jgi:dihydroorotate dehydrogenase (NAD+) catalytic subunit
MSTYRLDRSFEWNFDNGPTYDNSFPSIPSTTLKDYFGITTNSRIGIAASVLVNDKWIETYSRLGYDLLTYKTVRLIERDSFAFPNWVFVEREVSFDSEAKPKAFVKRAGSDLHALKLTGAGSFGMPSKAPEFWLEDIRRSRAKISNNQILIVSIVATPKSDSSKQSIIEEYGILARMVINAGAQVVEANLSCPNVRTGEGELYADPEMVGKIAQHLRKSCGNIPVTMKMGYIYDDEILTPVMQNASGFVDGLVLMNGINSLVLNKDETPTFGQGRESCGIIGRGIQQVALDYIKRAKDIILRHNLDLQIIGNGGIISPDCAQKFFDAGAYAVSIASGAIFDPHLGIKIKMANPKW